MPQTITRAPYADRGGSWMLPEAKNEALLYVTTASYGIYVFKYPSGKIVGIITNYGPFSPEGLCVDRAGDVFVTGESEIAEYAHGGTKPIAYLKDYDSNNGFYTFDCSVDLRTGSLAATIVESPDVAIFPDAKGDYPQIYGVPHAEMFWCAYDDKGNLFADQLVLRKNHAKREYIAELPAGSQTFKIITPNQSIGVPGSMQWDGKYLAIKDNLTSVVYRVKVAGSTGVIVGKVKLGGSERIYSFWIDGDTLIGAAEFDAEIVYWRYPAGGAPLGSIGGVQGPISVAVSR
jgi:hypothetical protein